MRIRWRAWTALLLMLTLIGCAPATGPAPQIPATGDETGQHFRLLEAYRGERHYYLRYLHQGQVYYAAGDLLIEGPDSIAAQPAQQDGYGRPRVSAASRTGPDDWRRFTAGLQPVPILGLAQWHALRERLFSEVMRPSPGDGIAVSFDRLDYYFYHDDTGTFRACRLADKPAGYRVAARVDLREHFDLWQQELARFLREQGVESDEVIFYTGDLHRGAVPFLYINTRSKLIVVIQPEALPRDYLEQVPGGHVLQTAWHFVESHSLTLVMRPFSSLQSLLAVTADTALQTGEQLLNPVSAGPPPPLNPGPPMDGDRWERYLDQQTGRPASRGRLRFLVDGEAFFTRLKDAFSSAGKSIDLRAYIFDNDDVALEMAELLKRRSNEGLEVRVLVDGLGTFTAAGESSVSLPADHRPPDSIERFLERDSAVDVRIVGNPWLTGDHVKTMVVDRRLAFLGGMNIGREYRYDWHDIMVEITGPVVDEINRDFDSAWGRAGFLGDFSALFSWGRKDVNGGLDGYPVRLLYTTPGRQEIFRLQREAIARARSHVFIENAYFTDDLLLAELVRARQRGVDVRVIIPLETDRGLITRNLATAANTMLASGIRVYIYPGFSHVKAAIFDGWACLGSANLDRLSLKINRELNVATSHPAAVAALREAVFEADFRHATEMTEPFPQRWTDPLIEMFGDYLF